MVAVRRVEGLGHRLEGDGSFVEFANRWLVHLEARRFAPGTVRGYAFDLLCLGRFFDEAHIDWLSAGPMDFFDWLEWQSKPVGSKGRKVVALDSRRGAAPATMNWREKSRRRRFRCVPGRSGHASGPGGRVVDAARWSARRGGPVAATR